jgi:hypothetical protein
MTIAPFCNRAAMVDQCSLEFLRTLVALGGYCTAAQAKVLSMADSGTATSARLRAWERAGFLRKVAAHPVVYQVTKSTTRLLDRDSSARRTHAFATVQARLLAVNFYLEARQWPAEFILDHEQKMATFRDASCPSGALPERGGEPYLWEDFVLWLADGRIGVATVDQPYPSAFSQLRLFVRRFHSLLPYMQNELQLLIATGNEHRTRLYARLLRHPVLRKISQVKLETAIKPYRVRTPVPTIRRLLYPTGNRWNTRHDTPWAESEEASEPMICDADFNHRKRLQVGREAH